MKNISVSFDYSRGEGGSPEEIKQDWKLEASVDTEGIISITGDSTVVKEFLEDYSLLHLFDFDDPAYEDNEAVYYVAEEKHDTLY